MPWNESDSDATVFSDYIPFLKGTGNNWTKAHDDLISVSGPVIKTDPGEYFRDISESPSEELSQWEMSLPLSPTWRCHGLLKLKGISEQMGPSENSPFS